MDYFKLIEVRESCRRYMHTPVRREMLDRCLEAARLAPSGHNAQPWRYVVVDNPIIVSRLAPLTRLEGTPYNKFTDQVPVLVVVAEKPVRLFEGEPGAESAPPNFSQTDIGLSVGQFCLAAADQGLATCIMGLFQEQPIKELLDIPEDHVVRLVVAVGHATPGDPRKKKRLDKEQMSGYNRFTPEMR